MYPEFSGPGATPQPPPQAPPEAPPVESAPTQAGPAAASDQRRSRRRRKRGGRGRQRGAAVPVAVAETHAPEAAEPVPVAEPKPSVEAPPQPVTPPPLPAPKPKPRGVVVLTVGLPGSGKSSWFRRRGITPLSSDLLRTLLFDNIAEQRYQDLVFSTLRSLLRARLIARMPWNYVDATNLSPKERRGWIKMAQEFGYEMHAVYFDVSLEVCQERNRRRQRNVPDDVMQRMAGKLRPPTFEEGFSKITVVRVKQTPPEPTPGPPLTEQPEEARREEEYPEDF